MNISCNDYKNISVFIFGAGGRQSLPVCKGFYQLGCTVIAYCFSKLDTGFLSRYVTKKIACEDEKNFLINGAELIKQNKYSIVVPLGDTTARYLAENKSELEKYSKIAVNDFEKFVFAMDKASTMQRCMDLGIPAPKTIYGDSILCKKAIESFTFPVVVKPRIGLGSIGFNIIKTKEKLEEYLKTYSNENGALLIQEYIKQDNRPQYRADFFRDRKGNYKTAIVGMVTRWYPIDGGSGIHCMTVHNKEIVANCERLLDSIDWNGYANIDLVWDANENKAKILEINGRTGASIKLDYVAGINISKQILENELDLEVTDYTDYLDGKSISCFLPDLLWLLKSPNRFSTVPSWFNRKETKDVIFSWDDPLPSVGFFIQSLLSYRESMKKRKRI